MVQYGVVLVVKFLLLLLAIILGWGLAGVAMFTLANRWFPPREPCRSAEEGDLDPFVWEEASD